tara:strand:+ start:1797 stop:2789 length:993 start_codon:yes stop_codon:yes gene_type:complete
MNLLITGGAGFIGSHMCGHLIEKNSTFTVIDNLSTSDLTNLKVLEKKFNKKINFYEMDLRDIASLRDIFLSHKFDAIIHFAGLKAVEESVRSPELYYDNNVRGSINLLSCIKEFSVNRLIFSSSATVYGEPQYLAIDEVHPISATNPYGQTKIDIENFLFSDPYFSDHCNTTILRYFNPVGAFYNGIIGEHPRGVPNNLMPYILGVANGTFPYLKIFGDDYKTHDGTAIRDYIHVMDLIEAHYAALDQPNHGIQVYNVGIGKGHSVLDMVKCFELSNGVEIPYKFFPRRAGDASTVYADTKKIRSDLSWLPKRSLEAMCQDAYQFMKTMN